MQLTPRDAQAYWLSSRIPNDQFLLYCFDGADEPLESVRAWLIRRAVRMADLRLRVHDVPRHLDYPYWVGCDAGDDRIVRHEQADPSWSGLTAAMAELQAEPLDASVHGWRIHLFPGVRDAPRCTSPALVAVLQISHALADGKRASALAGALFGSDDPVGDRGRDPRLLPDPVLAALGILRLPWRFAGTVLRGRRADRARRQLALLAARGEVPPEIPGRPLISVNAAPGPSRQVRMLVRPAAGLRGPDVTVTVAVLTAVGSALSRYESRVGARTPARLGAEVTVAYEQEESARNNFGNVGVELYPDEPDPRRRAAKIAAALADRRRRLVHPLQQAQRAVTAGLPAPAMWQEIVRFPLDLVPPAMIGNTVVSSVLRGADDLRLGGGRVRFTAGFPALSPVMGLTHGVHGIGDTVTITVVAGNAAMPDIDCYADLLEHALDEMAEVGFDGIG